MVRFGETEASLLISAKINLIARVPDGAAGGIVSVETSRRRANLRVSSRRPDCRTSSSGSNPVGGQIEGNIYVTYSGQSRTAGCCLTVQITAIIR